MMRYIQSPEINLFRVEHGKFDRSRKVYLLLSSNQIGIVSRMFSAAECIKTKLGAGYGRKEKFLKTGTIEIWDGKYGQV